METTLTLSDDEIKNFLREGAKNGNKILLQKALNAGANLDISLNQALTFSFIGKHIWNRDSLGYRAIHWAARYGREEIVQWLVEQGASLEQPNDVGNTALHVAVYYNQYQVVSKLLNLGANPNAVNHESTLYQVSAETPLHYAVLYSSDDMVKILRDFGADATFKDDKGKSPLAYAQSKGDVRLIDALTDYIPNSSPKPGHNLEFKPQLLQEYELFELAKGFLKSHELSQALECYSELLNRDSKNKKALIGKGHVFRAQLEAQKAIACYESVLTEDPESEDALFNKAMALIELCKYTEAISIIQQLIATKQTDEIGNYKDLARYMQQNYSYLPPNLDLEDVARAMTQSQQLSPETFNPKKTDSSSIEKIDSPLPPPPPPPLPPPRPVINPNPVVPRPPRPPLAQVQPLNIMDILQEEMKKRLAKMNPEVQQANINAKSNRSSDSDEDELETGSESSLKM